MIIGRLFHRLKMQHPKKTIRTLKNGLLYVMVVVEKEVVLDIETITLRRLIEMIVGKVK